MIPINNYTIKKKFTIRQDLKYSKYSNALRDCGYEFIC